MFANDAVSARFPGNKCKSELLFKKDAGSSSNSSQDQIQIGDKMNVKFSISLPNEVSHLPGKLKIPVVKKHSLCSSLQATASALYHKPTPSSSADDLPREPKTRSTLCLQCSACCHFGCCICCARYCRYPQSSNNRQTIHRLKLQRAGSKRRSSIASYLSEPSSSSSTSSVTKNTSGSGIQGNTRASSNLLTHGYHALSLPKYNNHFALINENENENDGDVGDSDEEEMRKRPSTAEMDAEDHLSSNQKHCSTTIAAHANVKRYAGDDRDGEEEEEEEEEDEQDCNGCQSPAMDLSKKEEETTFDMSLLADEMQEAATSSRVSFTFISNQAAVSLNRRAKTKWE